MSVLFTPKKIGEMEIQNRFVHSATYECMADDNGEVTEKLLKRYRRIVKGGVGLAELPINGLEVSCGTISYSMFNMVRGDVPTEEIISNFPLWRKIVGKIGIPQRQMTIYLLGFPATDSGSMISSSGSTHHLKNLLDEQAQLFA